MSRSLARTAQGGSITNCASPRFLAMLGVLRDVLPSIGPSWGLRLCASRVSCRRDSCLLVMARCILYCMIHLSIV